MHGLHVLNTQDDLFRISISHISLSGAERRYLPGFIPVPERALATNRSQNDRNKGLPNDSRHQSARAKKLIKDLM